MNVFTRKHRILLIWKLKILPGHFTFLPMSQQEKVAAILPEVVDSAFRENLNSVP